MSTLRVEFHCHTHYSKDSLTKPKDLVNAARRKGLDRLVVTDHNAIKGAFEAKSYDPELVIIGEEIMTTRGELLCAFMTEEIPPYLSPQETIERLRKQDAFISVSHPLDPHRGWKMADLLEILPLVDAIEIFNARCMRMKYNDDARLFAQKHNIPAMVGSDAHVTRELGRAYLTLPMFHNAESLRAALPHAAATAQISSPLIHATSRYAVLMKQLFPSLKPPR